MLPQSVAGFKGLLRSGEGQSGQGMEKREGTGRKERWEGRDGDEREGGRLCPACKNSCGHLWFTDQLYLLSGWK